MKLKPTSIPPSFLEIGFVRKRNHEGTICAICENKRKALSFSLCATSENAELIWACALCSLAIGLVHKGFDQCLIGSSLGLISMIL